MQFIFRVDGNSKIGLGHINRCLVLAEKLKKYGEVKFISKNTLPIKLPFKTYKISSNITLKEDMSLTKDIVQKIKPDVVIVDLDIKQRYLDRIKPLTTLLVAIDDINGKICSDVIINVNYFSLKKNYSCKNGKILLGPKYTLIKKVKPRKSVRIKANRILISMGGADVLNLTPKVINCLKKIDNIKATVVIGPAFNNIKQITESVKFNKKFSVIKTKNLLSLMLKHDLALCGGGTTLYELAASGTPAIVLCQAKNQLINSSSLDKKTIINLGMGNKVNKLKETIEKLLANYSLREKFSKNGKQLVDCRGPERVVKAILTELKKRDIKLKQATKKDSDFIWKLRNERSVRLNSFNTKLIPLKEHISWFKNALKSNKKIILIASLNKEKVGFVRVDVKRNPEISIAICKKYRGMGLGTKVIYKTCNFLNRKTVTAKVKPNNTASLKAFKNAGFKMLSKNKIFIKLQLKK